MRPAQACQSEHHESPDADEKSDDEQQDLPFGNRHVPEETPVSAIRLRPTVISSDDT